MFGNKARPEAIIIEQENKRLALQIATLNDQIKHLTQLNNKFQADYVELVKQTKSFCMSLLSEEYAMSQLGGQSRIGEMDIQTLFKYAIDQYHAKRAEERKLLTDLTKQLDEKNKQIEALEAEISRLMAKERIKKELGEGAIEEPKKDQSQEPAPVQQPKYSPLFKGERRMEIIEDEDEAETLPTAQVVAVEEKKGEPASVNEKKVSKESSDKKGKDSRNWERPQPPKRREQAQEKGKPVPHVVDLGEYMQSVSDVAWSILLGIGKLGLSEAKDLKQYVLKESVNEAAFNTALTQLRTMKIIDEEKLNTGWRWFYVYELSDIGKRIYLEKFKENPIDCEKQVLQKEHTSALHGYCIKDTAWLLKEIWGYTEVSYDRAKNEIKLPASNEVYIPDVIARRVEKDGSVTVDYFEVELGHHTQQDFDAKCDKMRRLTRSFYFVAPDANVLNRVLAKQLGTWVLNKGGKEHLKGITVYLTTLTKLKEREWDAIHPF